MRTGSTCAALLIGSVLAGCAQTSWTKPGVNDSQRDADLARCQAHAEDQTEDLVSRIEDTRRGVTSGEDVSPLQSDFRQYDERDRRGSLTAACMRQLGYSRGDSAADADDGTGAADDGS